MPLPVYDANWNPTGYYQKGGNEERKGVEIELIGRILPNLEVVAGYTHIDAQYKKHTSFFKGSAPLNTPHHTAMGGLIILLTWVYRINVGAGVYYISERPVNEWSMTITHEGIVPNRKPFNLKAYTIVNA